MGADLHYLPKDLACLMVTFLQVTYEKESNRTADELPKHGKEDPSGAPHVGGNTWAGGTGRFTIYGE